MAKIFRSFKVNRRLNVTTQNHLEFLYAVLYRGNQENKPRGTAAYKRVNGIKGKLDGLSTPDASNNTCGRSKRPGNQLLILTAEEYSLIEHYMETIHFPIEFEFANEAISWFETAEKLNEAPSNERGSV